MSSLLFLPILLIHHAYSDTITCAGDECICSPSYQGQKCTLNCEGQGKCQGSSLQCRQGDPCQINCVGLHACYGAVFHGGDATDLNITCNGYPGAACHSDSSLLAILHCGDGDCRLYCSEGACHGIIVVPGAADIWECSPIANCQLIGGDQHPGEPAPFIAPTPYPTPHPTNPSISPSDYPTAAPTAPTPWDGRTTASPTVSTSDPTNSPSNNPSMTPTIPPIAGTVNPTAAPSDNPSMTPTVSPTGDTMDPTVSPIANNVNPTSSPSYNPSITPTITPTANTVNPASSPSDNPTKTPTANTVNPTSSPSDNPTIPPTAETAAPTAERQGAVGEETTAAMQFVVELEITFKYNTTNITTDEIKLYLKNTANELITDKVDNDCSELDADDIDIAINNDNEVTIGTTIYVCDVATQKQLAADLKGDSIESDLVQKIDEDNNKINIVAGSTKITVNEVDGEEANTESTDNTSDLLFYALIAGAILGCCVLLLCIVVIIQYKKLKREKSVTITAPPKPTQLTQVYSDSTHNTVNNQNITQYVDTYDGPGYDKQNTLEMDGDGEPEQHHIMNTNENDLVVLDDINNIYKTPGPPPRRKTMDEQKKKDEKIELQQYEEDVERADMIVMPGHVTNDGFMKKQQEEMDEGENIPPPPLPPMDNNNNNDNDEYVPGPVPPPVPDEMNGNGKDEESEDSLDQLQHQFLSDEINKVEDETEIVKKTQNGLNDNNEEHVLPENTSKGDDNDENMLPPPIPPVPTDALLDDVEVTSFSTPQ